MRAVWMRCAVATAAALLLSGCVVLPDRVRRELDPNIESIVRTGHIVVSEQANAGSVFVSLLAEEFHPYVHAGVIVVEKEEAYVYEAWGVVRPFLGGPPTDAMGGSVRRVTLRRYLERSRIAAIYAPPPELAAQLDVERTAEFARTQERASTPFDAYFDARDPSRLYCTEFVARALAAGGAPVPREVPMRRNPSLGVALDWLRIDAPTLIPAGSLVEGWAEVAFLSQERSRAEATAYFAAKRELHERFSAHQRLGSVFTWSRFGGLKLRPEVESFLFGRPEQAKVAQRARPQ